MADHLLLAVIDELAVANWQRANAGRKRSQQTKPPTPLRRPGRPTKRGPSLAALHAFQRRTQRG